MNIKSTIKKQNGVYMASEPSVDFSEAYLKVRSIENRVYSNEIVSALPTVNRNHPQHVEWKMRQKSAKRFTDYLAKKKFNSLLEIGCGNGWFTNHCAKQVKHAIGVDVNQQELEQGAELFSTEKLSFINWDVFKPKPFNGTVDIIVLNASVQYFEDFGKLLKRLKELLIPKGEIHILDSPFYSEKELANARKRSDAYYQEKKVGEMSTYYFHHLLKEVDTFEAMYKPSSNLLLKYITGKEIPFTWYSKKLGN